MLMPTILTKANQRFIRANRLKMSGVNIAAKIGVSKHVVQRFIRCEGLQPPKALVIKWRGAAISGRTSSDAKTDAYLKKEYLKQPIKRLAASIGRNQTFVKSRLRQLGLVIPPALIEQRKKDTQIKPGNVPANKGKPMPAALYNRLKASMFKPGHTPPNTKSKDGVITIRLDNQGHPYKHIRVSVGKWVHYHRYKWERHRGPIPPGHCIWFKDGNSLNTNLPNLELITRAENMRRNTIARFPPEVRSAIHSLNKLKKQINSCETKLVTSATTSLPKSKGSTTKALKAKPLKLK
jgi:hypothetical protein